MNKYYSDKPSCKPSEQVAIYRVEPDGKKYMWMDDGIGWCYTAIPLIVLQIPQDFEELTEQQAREQFPEAFNS